MATTQVPTQEMATQGGSQDPKKAPGRPIEWSEIKVVLSTGKAIRSVVKSKDVKEEIKRVFSYGISDKLGDGSRTVGPDKIDFIDDYPTEAPEE